MLVVFGIQPTGPETGFGYIEVPKISRDIQPVLKFVEKPDIETAQEYLATGRYYWNSGMFCFKTQTILTLWNTTPQTWLNAARETWSNAATTELPATNTPSAPWVTRFNAQSFGKQPDISIDYAVMERATNVVLVPLALVGAMSGHGRPSHKHTHQTPVATLCSQRWNGLGCHQYHSDTCPHR
ncbi:MAG: sugar phosphate nucleotidyltransferase [Burkholderiaceae bacterium]